MLAQYFQKLGFSDKEQKIYLILAEVGLQPASVVARRSGLDRVTTYKQLKRLAERGFVKVYFREGTQYFGIDSFENIEAQLREKAETFGELLEMFPTAMNLLKSLKEGEDVMPRLQMFEGEAGIKSLFRDLLMEVRHEKVRQVRMLSSNTFEEWLGDDALAKTVREFYKELQQKSVALELFEITGGLVPERVQRLSHQTLQKGKLPVAHGSTNIFIVGHTVYFACYKGMQIGLKIKQAELSQIFHFVFDVLGKQK